MKYLITLSLLWVMQGKAQDIEKGFGVNVEVNPDHNGIVNEEWKNNFVISYTDDGWKTKQFIYYQATYVGYDDNGVEYYTSYFKMLTFQNKEDAIRVAKTADSRKSIAKFTLSEANKHYRLKQKYDAENKKLCFGCKPKKEYKQDPIKIL